MKSILITGATGFLGRNLIKYISRNDYRIIALVRDESSNFVADHPQIEFIYGTLEEFDKNLFSDLRIDILVHLAWGNVSKVQLSSHLTVEFDLQKLFLKNAVDSGLKEVIISGSCFEYGKIEGGLDVDTTPLPNTNYGIAKNNLRIWLDGYIRDFNIKASVVWLRIFYVYGIDQHERSLYSQLNQAIRSLSSEFNMSHGNQVRDFISIEEVCANIIQILEKNMGYGLLIKNICSGQGVRVEDFVKGILKKNNVDMKLNLGYYDVPDYEPLSFWGIK